MPDVDVLLESVRCEPMPEPEPEPTPEPAVPVGEEGAPYFGVWSGIEMTMDGYSMKLADYGMTMTLILLEDGKMIFTDEGIDLSDPSILDGIEAPGWRVENGAAIGDGCTMILTENDLLILDEEGSQLIFERAGDSPEDMAAPQDSAAVPVSELTASEAQGIIPGVKYICVNADNGGYTIDASMLGGEYSIIFHANGTSDFTVVGNTTPALAYESTATGFTIDYYGIPMEAVFTEAGFVLNYFDTMLMHFVPEA